MLFSKKGIKFKEVFSSLVCLMVFLESSAASEANCRLVWIYPGSAWPTVSTLLFSVPRFFFWLYFLTCCSTLLWIREKRKQGQKQSKANKFAKGCLHYWKCIHDLLASVNVSQMRNSFLNCSRLPCRYWWVWDRNSQLYQRAGVCEHFRRP